MNNVQIYKTGKKEKYEILSVVACDLVQLTSSNIFSDRLLRNFF